MLNIFILWKWLYIAIKSYEEIFWTFEAVLKLKTSENCTFYVVCHAQKRRALGSRMGGFLLCLRFFLPRSRRRARSCFAFGLLNRAAVGWAVSCSAFGLFIYLFFVLSVSKPKLPAHSANCCHRMMSPSANYRPFLSSFRHVPPQKHFVKLAN